MTDKQLIDKLILEWSWRCEKGYPDLNNPKDIKILEELFKINVREQQLSEKAKGEEDALYALDQKTSEEEDRKYVEKVLGNVRVEDIEQITNNPLFRTATSIEDFDKRKKEFFNAFQSLYNIKGEKGGRGELIALVSIKGAKLGGGNKKDITVNNQVMEVKELSKEIESGEFSTATSGNVIGSKFIKNFETFQRYLKPFEDDYSYEEKLTPLFGILTYTISAKNVKYLKELLNNFPIDKESLSDDFERIKFRGKYYAISKGGEATFKLDSSGNLISSTEQLQELDSKQVAIQKVLTHPWVQDQQELENNLNELRDNAMLGVNYYLFFKKEHPDFIKVVKTSDEKIQFSRITMNQVNLKYVHTDKQ